jgi:hypothetical protein
MKKTLVFICLLLSFNSFSQTCEEREDKLLGALGGLSAAYLYNTYAAIGAICDGYSSDTYSQSEAEQMLDSQKKLAENLLVLVNELLEEKIITEKSDQDFMRTSITIFNGLKAQAQNFQDYMKNKSDRRKEAYDEQRRENWKKISKLMGIKD